jgi:hypothetical protein
VKELAGGATVPARHTVQAYEGVRIRAGLISALCPKFAWLGEVGSKCVALRNSRLSPLSVRDQRLMDLVLVKEDDPSWCSKESVGSLRHVDPPRESLILYLKHASPPAPLEAVFPTL